MTVLHISWDKDSIMYKKIIEISEERKIPVQELLRAVIIPEWLENNRE